MSMQAAVTTGTACTEDEHASRRHDRNCVHSLRTPVGTMDLDAVIDRGTNSRNDSLCHSLAPLTLSSSKALPERMLKGMDPAPATVVFTNGCVTVPAAIARKSCMYSR